MPIHITESCEIKAIIIGIIGVLAITSSISLVLIGFHNHQTKESKTEDAKLRCIQFHGQWVETYDGYLYCKDPTDKVIE